MVSPARAAQAAMPNATGGWIAATLREVVVPVDLGNVNAPSDEVTMEKASENLSPVSVPEVERAAVRDIKEASDERAIENATETLSPTVALPEVEGAFMGDP